MLNQATEAHSFGAYESFRVCAEMLEWVIELCVYAFCLYPVEA
jgi:hypothetical protein